MAIIRTFFFSCFFIVAFLSVSQGQSGRSYIENQIFRLEEYLNYYQELNLSNQWNTFPCDSCLLPGDKSALIPYLRSNLLLTGDLKQTFNKNTLEYDDSLQQAVRNFQARHGLTEDAILGSQTLEALSVSPAERVQQIKEGIDKWKILSDTAKEPFVLVNIPDFSLTVADSGKVVLKMNVITGRTTHKTPEIWSEIKEIVFNPSWKIPHSIAVNEILPMLKNNPSYLKNNHIKVYTNIKSKRAEVNPDSIDWKKINSNTFGYFFEQVPGEWNALGKIKFLFPNASMVYLHDTPEKYLFRHPVRTYSHGCVRVEKPLELAAFLLKDLHGWNTAAIRTFLANSKEQKTVLLSSPIPVFIEYITCWVDENQQLRFRKDIYNRKGGEL